MRGDLVGAARGADACLAGVVRRNAGAKSLPGLGDAQQIRRVKGVASYRDAVPGVGRVVTAGLCLRRLG
jgi:hypothetical protein